jgi:NodT family efflux transporter outer membrane factor (OMF) lipoprotein
MSLSRSLVLLPTKPLETEILAMRTRPFVVSVLMMPTLSACVMGPDFDRAPLPPASMNKAFVRAEQLSATSVSSSASWWRGLNDPLLDQLIRRALSTSPSVKVAEARVRQARSQVRGSRAAAAPVVGTGAGAGNIRAPALITGGEAKSSSLFVTGFDALWEIDLFGGRRRSMEAAEAQFEASRAETDAARLSLSAEIARRYLDLRADQQRLNIASHAFANQQRIAGLTAQLEGAGKLSRIEREQADRDLEARRQAIIMLEAELNDNNDALAVLVGEAPGALDTLLGSGAPIPLPPADVAVGDPAAMIARRPDISAAEQRLRAANAEIGVAEAARMPRVSLNGVIGLGGAMKGNVASMDNLFSLAGPTLQWNIADFGRGHAAVDQAKSGRDEAEAGYRAVVLIALQDAEGSLNRYGEARRAFAIQGRNALSARSGTNLVQQSWQAGRSSALTALAAENEQLAAEDSLVQARAALTTQYVALQKALAAGVQVGSASSAGEDRKPTVEAHLQ